MAETVGSVSLDLVLNSKEFKSQLQSSVNSAVGASTKGMASGLKSAAAGLAKIAGAAFVIKKAVDFGAACLKLGSDLQEVQNVVDSTFTTMSSSVNEFASSAIKNFGLSETIAKKYVGTFGAMSKSFGFTEKEALNMSKTLTGLSGDVASFYNLSSDEAYTKLKSVFTGETESLKELGVVMTQNALDQFALEKGFGKTTKAMTEQEKVALRMAFVTDKLKTASGDFLRTQDSWANQTRVLGLQFDAFKAQIGQGLINALTPVIKVINQLMEKLVALATTFNQFTTKMFGNASSGASGAAASVSNLASGLSGAGDAASQTAKDTAKAAKKISKSLLGIDQINKLGDNSDSSGTDGSIPTIPDMTTGNTELTETDKKLGDISGKFKLITDMGNAFKTGFLDALNGVSFDKIITGLGSIKTSLGDIFHGTKGSLSDMLVSWAGAIGSNLGSVVKVGAGIGEAIIQGTSLYLKQNKGKLVKTLNNIFKNLGTYFKKAASVTGTIADLIYGFFTDGNTQQAIANCISIMSDLVLKPAELVSKFLADAFSELDIFFTEMAPLISTTLGNMASVIEGITSTISTVISDAFKIIGSTYDTYVGPALTNFREGFEKIVTAFLEGWNTYMYPVIQELIAEFNRIYDESIKPLMDRIGIFVGKLILGASKIYNEFVAPLVAWFMEKLWPNISEAIGFIGDVIGSLIGTVADVASGLIKSLGGIIDFVVGVFTGDWELAWTGVKDVFGGIFDAIVGVLKGAINLIIDGINYMIRSLNKIKIDLPEWAPGGAKSLGFNIGEIPKLAQGGYVGPNSPQLAMIGDNRHQGEIVTPENKMAEIVSAQLQPILSAINNLIAAIANGKSGDYGDIYIPVTIGGTTLDNIVVTSHQRQNYRSGGH